MAEGKGMAKTNTLESASRNKFLKVEVNVLRQWTF
jgi:hypothetical protein